MGGHSWLVDGDGRPRGLWRALLFAALFLVLVVTGLLLLSPFWAAVDAAGADAVWWVLLPQSGVQLGAALGAAWAMRRWVDRGAGTGLGFPVSDRVPAALGVGLAVGAAGLAAVVLLLVPLGGYRYTAEAGTAVGWAGGVAAALALLALPAFAEEAIFRGYLLRTLVEAAGPGAAIVVTSLLFGLVHGWNPNVTAFGLVNIGLAGVLLALAVLRTGALWFASAVHLGWNWVMAGPLDLPVSGLETLDVPLYDVEVTGPAWLTGGAFGPEGGLAGTLAALAVLALVLGTTRPGGALAGQPANGKNDRVEDR